jgi:hypothetical protein
MLGDVNQPFILWHSAGSLTNLSLWGDLLHAPEAPEGIRTGIGGVFENCKHPAMTNASPDESSIPCAAIDTLRESNPAAGKFLHYSTGGARIPESGKHEPYGSLHLLVRIEHSPPLIIVAKPDWQRETQLASLCFVASPALEAHANEV